MNQRRQVTLVAAASTLLAAAPMATVFSSWTWLIDCILAVASVCGAALLARSLRAPVWAQALAMAAALIMMVTLLFGDHAILGLIPTGPTLTHFGQLLSQAGDDIRTMGIPVPDRPGLLFLITLGVGGVALLVDLFAVGLRQPALAGMPMLPLYSIPVIVHDDSVSFIPFVIGALGFLWLLASDNVDRVRRFGRRFTGDGRDVDLWEPSPLAAAGRRLAVIGVVLAVLLPLAVPGMTGGLLDRFSSAGNGTGDGVGTGRPGASVNLFAVLSGQLNQNKEFDMVKVTTNDPQPYYLRFGTADVLTQAGFRSRTPVGGKPVTGGITYPEVNKSGTTQNTYQARVSIVNFNMALLPVYTQVTHTSKLDRDWLYDTRGTVVYSNKTSSAKVKQYNFDYVHTQYSAAGLIGAPVLRPDDPVMQQYTQVPSVPFVDTLVHSLTAGKTGQYAKVRTLFDYFSADNNFRYFESTKTGTSGSDIVDFLKNKQGYCEQYAAALAWLVRKAGFPARVAFGFTGGDKRNGDTYTLTNKNLHAWTEVYFSGYGWVPFDATPTADLVATNWAPDPNQTTAPTDPGSGADVPSTSASGGAGATVGPHDHDPDLAGGGGGPAPTSRWPIGLLFGFVVVVLLLALPAMRRGLLRRHRRLTGRKTPAGVTALSVDGRPPGEMQVVAEAGAEADAARAEAHAAWDELLDTMIDYRIPVDDAQTPRATVDALVSRLRLAGEVADRVRLVGRAEERARYARSPLRDTRLGAALRELRGAIAGRVSRRTRLVAVLLPASVLHRWRAATTEAITGTVAAVGRAREAVLRVASPRRLLPGRR